MIDEGADPLQMMRRMGHSDIRTTYNLYGHLFPDREDDLVAKLDERYSRALRANGREEKPGLEENGFDFSLTRRPFDASSVESASRRTLSNLRRRIVGPDGFEPSTSPLSGVRSNRAELWAPETSCDWRGEGEYYPLIERERRPRTRFGPRFDRGPNVLDGGVNQRPSPATI
jgi:hypothetical protein